MSQDRSQQDPSDPDRQPRGPQGPGGSSASSRLAQWTAPGAYALARIPKAVLLIAIAALLIAALTVEGVIGGLLLLVLGLFFGWLLLLAWPALPTSGRLIRLVVVGLIVYLAVDMFGGR